MIALKIFVLALLAPNVLPRLIRIPDPDIKSSISIKKDSISILQEIVAEATSCGAPDANNMHYFVIRAASPIGEINYLVVHYDSQRQLPVSVTGLHDSLNQQKNVERNDNFRMIDCSELVGKQMNCRNSFKMTPAQAAKSGRASWDRGHVVPVAPWRFSHESMDRTFYCVNVGPQDPATNQGPWNVIEQRHHDKLSEYPAYVMTGVCSDDNEVDGVTDLGYAVPMCWWKMICYKDPASKQTKVVSFIGNNTLIQYTGSSPEKTERDLSTRRPRPQQEVLNLMDRKERIEMGWYHAELHLLPERTSTNPSDMPTADDCISTTTLDDDTWQEWDRAISSRKYRN